MALGSSETSRPLLPNYMVLSPTRPSYGCSATITQNVAFLISFLQFLYIFSVFASSALPCPPIHIFLFLLFLFVLSIRQKPRIETSSTDPLQNSLKLSPPPPPVYHHLFFQQSSRHCFHTDVSNENFLGWLLHTTYTEWAAYPCDIFPFAYRFWWGDLRERDNLEELNVDQRITLTCIFKRWDGKAWTELVWPMIETGGGRL